MIVRMIRLAVKKTGKQAVTKQELTGNRMVILIAFAVVLLIINTYLLGVYRTMRNFTHWHNATTVLLVIAIAAVIGGIVWIAANRIKKKDESKNSLF
jgi:uncharacterized membrane protein